jgi:uncharacterized membrane protein
MRFYDYSPMYYHSSFWSGGFISILLNVLIWGLIIYLIVLLVKKLSGHHHEGCCGMHSEHGGDTEERNNEYYLDIAKERYAKGEIDKKHYDELKKEFSPHKVEEEEVEEENAKE